MHSVNRCTAFDADKIEGGEVVVKTMPEGTPFVTLDGVERKLSDRDLMICDKEKPMCIAGVFGGLDSGSTETTKDVFIESAYFHLGKESTSPCGGEYRCFFPF